MMWLKQIKQLIHEGIYVNNLNSIVAAASRGLESDQRVIPAFVMRQIAQCVLDMWDGRPLQQREQRIVESGLRPPFDALIDAMLRESPRDDISNLTETLVRAWQTVQGDLQELADLTDQ